MGQSLDTLLAEASDVLARLEQVDLDEVVDDGLAEAVMALQGLRCQLEATEAKVLARWDASGVWRASGAKTAASWLTWQQRIPIDVARQRLRHARGLRDLPAVAEAWAKGEIDRAHVTSILGARTPRSEHAYAEGHLVLLDHARTMAFTSFKQICDRWSLVVDPDGAEAKAEAGVAARSVHLNQSFGNMWFGKMTLDPVAGEIVHTALAEIERELFEADWAAAKERLGRTPLVAELGRTSEQRRADAMTEMAIRARTAPADGRRPAPLFTVVVGLETLQGPILELFNRTVITPGTAARWLTDADVERIVFDPPSRVIDVGTQRRFFRGALRRALEIRDRTCFHPSCDEVPHRPEADHIQPVAQDGLTTQDNGRWGCGFHNRWRNHHPDHGEGGDDDGDDDGDDASA